MELRIRQEGEAAILELSGEFTIGKEPGRLKAATVELLDRGTRSFVVDFRPLTRLDSAGVGEFVACAKRVAEKQGAVRVALPKTGPIRRIFEITQLDRIFER
jgi:anti-anti-sigma factor